MSITELEKPFACNVEGCDIAYANKDHLEWHQKKHDMVLNIGLANKNSMDSVDQTPTPTRFIRNCEEVGLFQDLQNVNPFDETFKKAIDSGHLHLPEINTNDDSTLHTPHIFPPIEAITTNKYINDNIEGHGNEFCVTNVITINEALQESNNNSNEGLNVDELERDTFDLIIDESDSKSDQKKQQENKKKIDKKSAITPIPLHKLQEHNEKKQNKSQSVKKRKIEESILPIPKIEIRKSKTQKLDISENLGESFRKHKKSVAITPKKRRIIKSNNVESNVTKSQKSMTAMQNVGMLVPISSGNITQKQILETSLDRSNGTTVEKSDNKNLQLLEINQNNTIITNILVNDKVNNLTEISIVNQNSNIINNIETVQSKNTLRLKLPVKKFITAQFPKIENNGVIVEKTQLLDKDTNRNKTKEILESKNLQIHNDKVEKPILIVVDSYKYIKDFQRNHNSNTIVEKSLSIISKNKQSQKNGKSKDEKVREMNRVAQVRCRKRKQLQLTQMEEDLKYFKKDNQNLNIENQVLKQRFALLKELVNKNKNNFKIQTSDLLLKMEKILEAPVVFKEKKGQTQTKHIAIKPKGASNIIRDDQNSPKQMIPIVPCPIPTNGNPVLIQVVGALSAPSVLST